MACQKDFLKLYKRVTLVKNKPKTIPKKIKSRNIRKTCRFIKNRESIETSGKQMRKHKQPLKKQRQDNTGDYIVFHAVKRHLWKQPHRLCPLFGAESRIKNYDAERHKGY